MYSFSKAWRVGIIAISVSGWLCESIAAGISQTSSDPNLSTTLTLRVQGRLVVEDVLVTDTQGKPIHGLPQSAFHIFDQGALQTIQSFEEGPPPESVRPKNSVATSLPPGVFTNADARDSETTSEVLLIDADDMLLQDQMFLLQQLRKSILSLPAGLQVSLFRVSNGRPVQIRGMTTDRDDLWRAVGECLPVQTHAIDNKLNSALDQLLTVAGFLEGTGGRKNLVWFAGEFPLVDVSSEQMPGSSEDFRAREHTIHQIQEALAEARISVFPVDVRGVMQRDIAPPGVGSNDATGTRSMAAASGVGKPHFVQSTDADGVATEREQMQRLAKATGGKAYMLNNLSEEISEAFDLGLRAYTLSYTPSRYVTDESWHTVSVTVNGNYKLSYRPGYLATWTGTPNGRQGFRLEDGEEVSTNTQSGHGSTTPIVFTVKVEPQSESTAKHGKQSELPVTLRFRIPVPQLDFEQRNGQWSNQLLVCSYVYDSDGKMKGGRLQELDTTLNSEQWQRAQTEQVSAEQQITIPKGAEYLLITVRDKRSKRAGTYSLSKRAVLSLSLLAKNP